MKLTIGYIYYCNREALSRHTAAWSAFPKHLREKIFFLIVDDGSPRAAALPSDVPLRIAIIRIEQDIPWNIGGARNLIMATAPSEHVVLMDMDTEIPLRLATQMLHLVQEEEKKTQPRIFYQFSRVKNNQRIRSHPAVILLRKSTYWFVGGCDEDFVGAYGVTDVHFRWRASTTTANFKLLRSVSSLEPLHSVLSAYDCKTIPKNKSRNVQLFDAKKTGRVAWSAEYLRFTWHVARASTFDFDVNRGLAKTDRATTSASGAPTNAQSSSAIFFTSLIDVPKSSWPQSQLMKLSTLSSASAINLNSTLFVALYKTFKHMREIEKLATTQPHMQLRKFPVLMNRSKQCWVVHVELLKHAFLQIQPQGALCVYVELDQLFLPGAGSEFQAVFASRSFDIAYTYNRKRTQFGSTNTGVILFRASDRVTRWLKLMASTTSSLTKYSCKGGENQKVIDRYMPHLEWNQNRVIDGLSILSLPYPGPLNFNAVGCCSIPDGIFVVHLKSRKKAFALSSCCRDRVKAQQNAWLATCTCQQKNASSDAYCWPATGSFTAADAAWCGVAPKASSSRHDAEYRLS